MLNVRVGFSFFLTVDLLRRQAGVKSHCEKIKNYNRENYSNYDVCIPLVYDIEYSKYQLAFCSFPRVCRSWRGKLL
jgi:hypothetical protein